MKTTKIALALLATFILNGCETEHSTENQDSLSETTPQTEGSINPSALFNPISPIPADKKIPFPHNALFAGHTDDTINIPDLDETDLSNPQVALNALDGFSTVAPWTTEFNAAIDETSISATSVRMYELGATTVTPLVFDTDYEAKVSPADSSGFTLMIQPKGQPLKEKTQYAVVITSDLKSTSGASFGPSTIYRQIKALTAPLVFCPDPTAASCELPGFLRAQTEASVNSFEALRAGIQTLETTLSTVDATLDAGDIILSWAATTQSIGDVLADVQASISGGTAPASALQDSGADSPMTGQVGFVGANIYVGTLTVPYYLTAASSSSDPTPLASFWKGTGGSFLTHANTTPVKTSDQTIPLMASIPNGTMPGGGWPVVIYQHGITTNRATMLAIADAMANAGLAVVAIDMPMHGLTGNETDGTQNFYMAGSERTFDLDLVNNTTSVSGGDGITDTSGTHFINLSNLLNTRDNVRQAVSDLFALTHALGSTVVGGGVSFDTSRIYFLGHSLGAMVGTTFAALEPSVRDVVFAFGGGSLPKILDGSASFGPRIAAGLAQKGVSKGTTDFESFLAVAQTVVDTADPVNHAASAAGVAGRGVLYFEIVGGNSSPSDLVVPNRVRDGNDTSGTVAAPLAGTEPTLTLMGLTQVDSDQASGSGDLKHSVKFVSGDHASLLSPTADVAVTAQIQGITAEFLATDGASLNVDETTSGTVIKAP